MKLLLFRLLYFFRYLFNQFFRTNIYSEFVSIQTTIGKGGTINRFTTVDKDTTIGNYTYIGISTYITKTTIGNYTSIANNVIIGQGEHNINNISTSCSINSDSLTLDTCRIGHDVWIGANVCILRGVEIGNGAVVGAGAVVTTDVPPFSVVVGVPAKVMKYRFTDEKILGIENSNWWEHDRNDAIKLINELELNFKLRDL